MSDTLPSAATPAPYSAAAIPGKTLGIVALIVTFFASVIGIILGFVARSQSKAAGVKNTPATFAIVLGFIFLAVTITVIVVFTIGAGSLLSACAGLEPGTYILDDGRTLTCG